MVHDKEKGGDTWKLRRLLHRDVQGNDMSGPSDSPSSPLWHTLVELTGGEPYICRAAAAPPTLVQQLFIGNKQDTPLRAFDLGFSMHVVTSSSIQVNKEDEFSMGLCLCSC